MKFFLIFIFLTACTFYTPRGIEREEIGDFDKKETERVYYQEQYSYNEGYRLVQLKQNNLHVTFYYIGDSIKLWVIDNQKVTYYYNGEICTLYKILK